MSPDRTSERPWTIEPGALDRLQQLALAVGVASLIVCGIGALLDPPQFFHSYLVGYLLWVGVSLGCLAVMMIHHLSGGAWGLVIRRMLEASSRTLPWMAMLFVPMLFGLRELYPWARPEATDDALLRHKAIYLNVPFFIVRSVVYFVLWSFLALRLSRWSLIQDRGADPLMRRRMQNFSAAGVLVYGLTVTFAAIDWVMSLEPHWFSTIFGMILMGGQGLASLSVSIVLLWMLSRRRPLSEIVSPKQFHDLGNLLLAFVMLWAYFSFSQFLLIWAGNLPEEIPWYLHRFRGGWLWIAGALIVFHFMVPFALLLSRRNKRRGDILVWIAGLLLVMRLIDLVWLVEPELHAGGVFIHWMDVLAPIGLGGVWLALFLWQVKDRPLLPLGDSELAALEEDVAHGV